MLIFAVDDEPESLQQASQAIQAACPDAETLAFPGAGDALAAIRRHGLDPDAAFCGVVMSGMGGLEFLAGFRELCPHAGVIFVTAFPQYAAEAYRVHADGYVIKPLTPERVREELDCLAAPRRKIIWDRAEKLQVQCFGRFEVFWRGEPLKFGRRRTKELFALLIDKEGAACTAEEIGAALWEDESDLGAMKARIRKLAHDMRRVLRSIGQEDAFTRRSGEMAVRRDKVDCDYYQYLKSAEDAPAFYGEYMSQYAWAREKEGRLYFSAVKYGGGVEENGKLKLCYK